MNGKVTCELLNVRKTPEKTGNVATTVAKDTELQIIGEANGWLQVKSDTVEGYVMAEFVAIEAEPEPAAAAKSEEPGQDAGQGPEGTPEPGQAAAEEPEKPKKSRKKGGEEDEQTGAAE